MTICLTIHAFCKVYERETVFVLIRRIGRTISGSQLLQNMGIIKQTVYCFGNFEENMNLSRINLAVFSDLLSQHF